MEPTNSVPAPAPAEAVSEQLLQQVKASINEATPTIFDTVVQQRSAKIVAERVKVVEAAISKIEQAQKDLKKIKPATTFPVVNGVEGQPVDHYSKEQMDQRRKLLETIINGNNAIRGFMNDPAQYDRLVKYTGQQKENKDGNDAAGGDQQ
jgi:hypothetical protein